MTRLTRVTYTVVVEHDSRSVADRPAPCTSTSRPEVTSADKPGALRRGLFPLARVGGKTVRDVFKR